MLDSRLGYQEATRARRPGAFPLPICLAWPSGESVATLALDGQVIHLGVEKGVRNGYDTNL